MYSENNLRQMGRLIGEVSRGRILTREEACDAYRQVILNEQPELQQGAFLLAHITRGPTTEELAGVWDALDLYDTAKIRTVRTGAICDIVGTGSDALKTVNCSTPAAVIAAACGLTMAKKGARLVTGVSGASDILEELGLDLNAPLSKAQESLDLNGICYLPGEAFLKSGWARLIQSMRFTSAFNIIGPLTMPCPQTDSMVIGAYSTPVCDQLIEILRELKMPAAVSPFGMADDISNEMGMDEFSPCGTTRTVELRNGAVSKYDLRPEDFGVKTADFESIRSRKTAADNASLIAGILREKRVDEPLSDLFCMNSGAALFISGTASSFKEGTEKSRHAMADGRAWTKMQELVSAQGGKA
ncbi:MAG: anthranilate phosphoribosyltransferase [Victivallales bacterium]|jgi:anthranilate phosphoribosyltransferase